MRLLDRAGAIVDRVLSTLAVLGGSLLILAMLLVAYDVVMRYLLTRPQVWTIETCEYFLLYITFLGAAWVLKREGHVSMDLVLTRLKPEAGALLNIITSIVGAIVFLVIACYSGLTTWNLFQQGVYVEGSMLVPAPPKGALIAIISAGSFLLFIQCVRRAYGYCLSQRAPIKEEELVYHE